MTLRIAMWSGPRNISTAMMRAWSSRPDCFVCDEPLYAHYLLKTNLQHPGREETLAHHSADWREVIQWLTGPIPDGKPVWYQKHMAHHLLPEIDRQWLDQLTSCFLIREPREMLTSLIEFIPEPRLADTGLPQQVEIFQRVHHATGSTPPVLDSRDVQNQPRRLLEQLCQHLGLPFCRQMLCWESGPRSTDGAWAKYWYDKVNPTTGFSSYRPKNAALPQQLETLLDQCQPYYQLLYEHRMT